MKNREKHLFLWFTLTGNLQCRITASRHSKLVFGFAPVDARITFALWVHDFQEEQVAGGKKHLMRAWLDFEKLAIFVPVDFWLRCPLCFTVQCDGVVFWYNGVQRMLDNFWWLETCKKERKVFEERFIRKLWKVCCLWLGKNRWKLREIYLANKNQIKFKKGKHLRSFFLFVWNTRRGKSREKCFWIKRNFRIWVVHECGDKSEMITDEFLEF